jgi:hypothetical protein
MAYNLFNNAAWYLYAYTGVRSYEEWRETALRVWAELKEESGSQYANDVLTKMVAYYCLEVGGSYKGDVAASKFKRCYRWSDFKEAFTDKESILSNRWRDMRDLDKKICEKRLELAKNSIPPMELVHESRSREAVRVVVHEIARRHGLQVATKNQAWVRELVSIYGSEPFLKMSFADDDLGSWRRTKLANRDLIPNLLTSYFLERAIFTLYGDRLDKLKAYSLSDTSRG